MDGQGTSGTAHQSAQQQLPTQGCGHLALVEASSQIRSGRRDGPPEQSEHDHPTDAAACAAGGAMWPRPCAPVAGEARFPAATLGTRPPNERASQPASESWQVEQRALRALCAAGCPQRFATVVGLCWRACFCSMFVVAARLFCDQRSLFSSPLASRCGLFTRSALKVRVASVPTMGLPAISTPPASFRVDRIGGHATEILEVCAERPSFQVLFVPGNPGVVAYYKEFLEALFDHLDGQASVTAISHIAHVSKDWELGKSFSLQDQINHKVQFVRDRLLLEAPEVPLLLVGHSIGAYIALEILKKFPSQVQHVIGLYPFVTLNKYSKFQSVLGKVAASPVLCTVISSFAGLVGRLPKDLSRVLVKVLLGRVWDPLAIDVTCQYMLQKNVVNNFLYMGRTEFASLSPEPDWVYLKENQNKTSFLFGIDDHWGPLSLLDEISKRAPELHVATEREGHLHAFCCTKAGSKWVARFAADTIFNQKRCARL